MVQSRQPEGIPAGGQFASSPHTEADVALPAPTVSPQLAALHRARTATTEAEETHAKAAYAYIVSEAASRWPTAAGMRLERDESSGDWVPDSIVDADGTEVADYMEASQMHMMVSEIQECGWAGRLIDNTGEDDLHDPDRVGDEMRGVMRFDLAYRPPVDSEIDPGELEPGDEIVGDMGGTARIVGEVGPSNAWPGFVRAEVEQGTLLLDADLPVTVRRDA